MAQSNAERQQAWRDRQRERAQRIAAQLAPVTITAPAAPEETDPMSNLRPLLRPRRLAPAQPVSLAQLETQAEQTLRAWHAAQDACNAASTRYDELRRQLRTGGLLGPQLLALRGELDAIAVDANRLTERVESTARAKHNAEVTLSEARRAIALARRNLAAIRNPPPWFDEPRDVVARALVAARDVLKRYQVSEQE